MYNLSIQNLPKSFMFESSADTTQILVDIPLEYLPIKGNTYVVTVLLQFLDWSALYSLNFSMLAYLVMLRFYISSSVHAGTGQVAKIGTYM